MKRLCDTCRADLGVEYVGRTGLAEDGPCVVCDMSDGHHTMSELYQHRHRLFIALMSHNRSAWWSRLHNDGSSYEGWIIAGIHTTAGMVSYHLPESFVGDMPPGTSVAVAPEWDGYTPDDVLDRLRLYAARAKEGE